MKREYYSTQIEANSWRKRAILQKSWKMGQKLPKRSTITNTLLFFLFFAINSRNSQQ